MPPLIPKAHRGQIAGPHFAEEVVADLLMGKGPIVGVGFADHLNKLFWALTHQILHSPSLFWFQVNGLSSMPLDGGPLRRRTIRGASFVSLLL
jgi:hypothetical protein